MDMGTNALSDRRLKFFGLNDHGTYWQSDRLVQVLDAYEPAQTATLLADAIELYNALQFLENRILPKTLTDAQRAGYLALVPSLRKTIGTFFGAITEDSMASVVVDVDYNYLDDLLELFAQHRVFERCAASVLLPVLDGLRIGTGWMLACKKLVVTYDQEIRERLLADPRNAEELARKYMERDQRRPIHGSSLRSVVTG